MNCAKSGMKCEKACKQKRPGFPERLIYYILRLELPVMPIFMIVSSMLNISTVPGKIFVAPSPVTTEPNFIHINLAKAVNSDNNIISFY